MFYKINGKYYVNMRTYYKEVVVSGDSVAPSTAENSRIEDMKVEATPISYEELLKETKKTFRRNKNEEE